MTDQIAIQRRLSSAFHKLWLASSVSNLADGVGLTAAPLLAAALTRDPALVAGLALVQRLPWLLFSLISGALVDRLDRRTILQWGSLSRGVLLGVLGAALLLGWMSLPLLYVVFFLLGIVETFFDNAAFAILPAIVEQEQLESANGRLFATQTITNEFVGPPLGSFLFAIFNAVPFLISGVTYGVAAVLVGQIKGQFGSTTSERDTLPMHRAIVEGLRWFWAHRLIRTLGIMAAIMNFVSAATFSIFVLYTQDVLGLNEAAYGLLLAAGAVGGVLSGLVTSHIVRIFGTGRTIWLDALVMALAYLVIGITSNVFVVAVMFLMISLVNTIGNIVVISLRQSLIPSALLGRVTSAYRFIAIGAAPLGAAAGGIIARLFGLSAPFWMGGIVLLILTVVLLPILSNESIEKARQAAETPQSAAL